MDLLWLACLLACFLAPCRAPGLDDGNVEGYRARGTTNAGRWTNTGGSRHWVAPYPKPPPPRSHLRIVPTPPKAPYHPPKVKKMPKGWPKVVKANAAPASSSSPGAQQSAQSMVDAAPAASSSSGAQQSAAVWFFEADTSAAPSSSGAPQSAAVGTDTSVSSSSSCTPQSAAVRTDTSRHRSDFQRALDDLVEVDQALAALNFDLPSLETVLAETNPVSIPQTENLCAMCEGGLHTYIVCATCPWLYDYETDSNQT